ncbi:MAG: hypothetical protein ACRDK4_07360 [Solirubrobacteraceae bacterium]
MALLMATGLALCLHAGIASAYSYTLTTQFGAKGEAAGQMQAPAGLAVDDSTHDLYVADRENHRVDKFASDGKFIAAWGWGVLDGASEKEVCTSVCISGLSGTGVGQFESPVAVAVDNSTGSSRGDVYVADQEGKRVQKFSASGEYLWKYSTPYELLGVSVDSAGRMWTYDGGGEVRQFGPEGGINNEWNTHAGTSVGLAVDDSDNVYANRGCGCIEKFSQAGQSLGEVAPGYYSSALAINQVDNTLFSVSGSTVYKYRPSTTQPSPLVTSFESGSLSEAMGVAVDPEREDVYVASRSSDEIFVFGPPLGPPQIEDVSTSNVLSTSAKVTAQIYNGQFDTTYQIEYGTTEAYGGTAPITPKDSGSGIREVVAEQILEGLSPETTYHYRLSATNSQGTVRSVDHIFTTFSPPRSTLPDDRAYELVSPPNKNDADVGIGTTVEGQASADGTAIKYVSAGVFSGSQDGGFSEYLSRRSSEGWQTQGLDPPGRSLQEASLVASSRAFTADLSKEVLLWPFGALTPEAPSEQNNIYLGNTSDGTYQLLAPGRLNEGYNPRFVGASTSFEVVVFDFHGVLTKNAAPEGNNVYEWHNGVLTLVSVAPGQSKGAIGATGGAGEFENQNAVSADGRRVFWSDGSQQLYVYEGGVGSVKVNASQRTPSLGDGNAQFMGATTDGRLVFFKDTVALTNDTGDNGGLYEYDTENGTLSDLTPDESEEPSVSGIVGYAGDGSYVYFVAEHPLAAGGATQAPNLYVTHDGKISFIATLAGEDWYDWSRYPTQRTAEVTPSGADLVFVSSAQLTGYDNTEHRGWRASEVFEYDAREKKLHCVSCNPTGTAPVGGSTVSTWTTPIYDTHYVSNDGSRVFFNSEDVLAAHDTDGVQDVYEWERGGAGGCVLVGGCVYLISSGTSEDASRFAAAGENGNDVFFATRSALVPEDGDEKKDIYDARVNGGFSDTSNKLGECAGEGCLGPLGTAPTSLTPLTSAIAPPALAHAKAKPQLNVSGIGNSGLARLGRTGRLMVGVAVTGGGRAWAKVTTRLDGRVKVIAFASVRVSGAGRVNLRLRLDRAARRALARWRRLEVTIAIGYSGVRTRRIVATLRSGR